MARHYEKLLEEVVRDAEQTIKEIELLSGAEREQILIGGIRRASVSERSVDARTVRGAGGACA